jgi:hypothetical protein
MRLRSVSSALLLFAAIGCGKKTAPSAFATPGTAAKDAVAAPAKAAGGVVIGTVRLAPGQELPSYNADEMELRILRHIKGSTLPDICSPPKLADRTPVQLTADGKLSGVMLAASEFSARPSKAAPKVHEVDIRDCRLTPNMVLARPGDMLHLKNEVDYPLMPGMGTEPFSQTLIKDQTRDIKLDHGGVFALRCGFTAPCGRTDVIVLSHEYSAVTDDKGEFRIENFPADETVKLNAWHPLFSETFVSVRVAKGETKRVELVLTPKPPEAPKPTAAPKPTDGPKPVPRSGPMPKTDPQVIQPH